MMQVLSGATARAATWRICAALLIWAVHFLAIYGITALACAREGAAGGFGVDAVPWLVGAATLVAAAVLLLMIGLAVRDWRRAASSPQPLPFMHWLTATVSGLALLAVLWETLPVLLVPTCS